MMKHTTEYITVTDDVLSPRACNDLIKKFESKSQLERDSEYYSFKEINLNEDKDFEIECKTIQGVATQMVKAYKDHHGLTFMPDQFMLEQIRMKKYEPNDKDSFDWHVDVGDHGSARRFLVCMFYLNTVEEGGETAFDGLAKDDETIKIKTRGGRLVMFPPMWMYPHKGKMPIGQSKYILSTYAHYA